MPPSARENPPVWHALDAAQALERAGSAYEGLSQAEARRRLSEIGPNALPEKPAPTFGLVFIRQFRSPLIYLLFAAAAIAFALGERSDAAVIIAVVLFNALIGTLQERRAERSMAALRRIATIQTRVVRDGVELLVEARELVPGDVILVGAGDAVTVDARLLTQASLSASESALTGESVPVAKNVSAVAPDTALADRQDMLYAGTHVTSGRGRAVAIATGPSTEVGRIAHLAEATEEPKSPLERRIERLGHHLVFAGAGVFLLVLAIGLARGVAFTEMLMVAISQLVSVVPEGLPVAVTIALAVGMQRMAARRVIVRRLSAAESLGSTTVICSDKTGTLTRNEMTVTALYLHDGRSVDVTGAGYAPRGTFEGTGFEGPPEADAAVRELLEAVTLCNDAELAPPGEDGRFQAVGDPTEAALLTLARKGGIDTTELRARRPRSGEIPFDERFKLMVTRHGDLTVIKGAPEVVLGHCSHVRVAGGTRSLAADDARRIQIAGEAMAKKALRLLGVAVCESDPDDLGDHSAFASRPPRATFLGLVGQIDPPREEVREAVSACRQAGIRTVMVTGDHKVTGLAVARELGIAGEQDIALDDRELGAMSEDELRASLPSIAVFARVPPAQKLRIVEAFQASGEVVAMTGDGINDAPALARADVGVAMGLTGTEAAKQAAEIVITDDHFSTIVNAVEEGRVVFQNLRKVLLLLLSCGIAEVLVLLGAVALGYPLPLVAVQILWINVVTEGTITINLVLDPREGGEMRAAPRRGHAILDRLLVNRMALLSATIAAIVLGFFVVRTELGMPLAEARTATFTLLAVCEWFNVLNCRSETRSALNLDLFRNRWLVGGLVVSNLLQAAVVFTPTLNRVFHTVPLPLSEVLFIGLSGSLVLWVEEARKYLVRRRAHVSEEAVEMAASPLAG